MTLTNHQCTLTFSRLFLSPSPSSSLLSNLREELIEWFVRLQLSEYEVMFHESLEVAWLDKVDRRYAWLRRTFVNYEEECGNIFPQDWGIPERVSMEFCSQTR